MAIDLQPVCPRELPCKCCGATAAIYGVVDFSKNCSMRRGVVLPPTGVPIYYHRCPACQFIFTGAFDLFTEGDFRRHIYNDDYRLVDPDFEVARPRSLAQIFSKLFPENRPSHLLDYGGGNGAMAEALRAAGFPHVDTYDPLVPRHATRPAMRYDCITSFEVAEHSTDPKRTFADMVDLLADPGLIVFSTLVQPADIDKQGLNWWYAGPRNGHVSLFSRASLGRIVQSLGFTIGSFNDNMHIMFRTLPAFAKHLGPRPS
jgi:2-polyprenyl-6-hydroxyphenyl methylase/3-demethylubiquinone-9 3-methyltransferase